MRKGLSVTVYDEAIDDVEPSIEHDEMGFEPPESEALESTESSTYDDALKRGTGRALAELRIANELPSPAKAAALVLSYSNAEAACWAVEAGEKLMPLRTIRPRQAADVAMLYLDVALIPATESQDSRSTAMIGVYDAAEGLYEECSGETNLLTVFLRSMVYDSGTKWIAESVAAIRDLAPLRYQCDDPDLVPLDDCIYRMSTGDRLPYTPERVYMAKARTRLPETEPELPRIQNPDGTWWDPESWVLQTMGTPDLARQVHEVNNYLLRVRAFSDDKVVIYDSETGNNGKGTMLSLHRGVIGGPNGLRCATVPFDRFGNKDVNFALASMLHAAANLCDESETGAFLSSSAAFKQVTSHDPIEINRKHRDALTVKLFVGMVFSMNKKPKFKDKTEAVLRRLHIVPFGNRFMSDGSTEIVKNPLIKADYVKRPEVREWFVWQALKVIGPITEFSVPDEVAQGLEDYREDNDPIIDFWRRVEPQFTESRLDHLPLEMLYDVHKAESRAKRGTSAAVESIRTFSDRLVEEARKGGVWREERHSGGRRERKQKSMTAWSRAGAPLVDEMFSDLGRSWIEERSVGGTKSYYEQVAGDERVARWGRHSVIPGAARSSKSIPLPPRTSCLVRDLPPLPPLPPFPPGDALAEFEALPITEAEIAGFADWLDRDGAIPPEFTVDQGRERSES